MKSQPLGVLVLTGTFPRWACPPTLPSRVGIGLGSSLRNGGNDTLILAVSGVHGWAGVGRINDATTSQPIVLSTATGGVTVTPKDWIFTRVEGNASGGSLAVATFQDLRCGLPTSLPTFVPTGAQVVIAGHRFFVAPMAATPFTGSQLPLSSPFLSSPIAPASNTAPIYLVGPGMGSYDVAFTPTIRGKSTLIPAVGEVPAITIQATSALGGTFTLSVGGVGTTAPIPGGATASQVAAALAGVAPTLITVAPTVEATSVPLSISPFGTTYTIAFAPVDGNVPQLTISDAFMSGNDRLVFNTTTTQGSPALPVAGSGAVIEVVPGGLSAPMSTAYGPGQYSATAGSQAWFTVQLKDAYGNNLYTNASTAPTVAVEAFLNTLPQTSHPTPTTSSWFNATSTPGPNGTVSVTYTPPSVAPTPWWPWQSPAPRSRTSPWHSPPWRLRGGATPWPMGRMSRASWPMMPLPLLWRLPLPSSPPWAPAP